MSTSYRHGVIFADERDRKLSSREFEAAPAAYDNGLVFINENERRLSTPHARTSLSKIRSHVVKFRSTYPVYWSRYESHLPMSRTKDERVVHDQDWAPAFISPLDQWDPFDSLAVDKPRPAERKAIHWGELLSQGWSMLIKVAANVLWRRCTTRDRTGDVFVKKYMAAAIVSPLFWHTTVMAVAIKLQAYRKDVDERRKFGLMAAYHRVISIQHLQLELRKCENGAVEDHVISAVYALALPANFPAESDCGEDALKDITQGHPYVRYGFGIEHMNALYVLVERKGGLNALQEEICHGYLQQ
jgi:hypothetical protein